MTEKLESMEEISAGDLEQRFASGQIFKEGGIRIWKDETGRFGDPTYKVESLRSDAANNKLILDLSNNEQIEIEKPEGFFAAENTFVIKQAESVSWRQQGIRILTYTHKGHNIIARSAIPYKHFDTSVLAPALEIYTM